MSAEPTYIPIMNLGQHSSKQSVGLVVHLMHGVKWVLTLSNVKATNLFPYLPDSCSKGQKLDFLSPACPHSAEENG